MATSQGRLPGGGRGRPLALGIAMAALAGTFAPDLHAQATVGHETGGGEAAEPGATASGPLPPGTYAPPSPIAMALSQPTPIVDPRRRSLRALHAALRAAAAGQGQARIAVWGASHTAADLWTGQLRRALQQRFGDAGHGYVLPLRWHGGVRHQDIVIDGSAGWTLHRHRELNAVPTVDGGYPGVAASSASTAEWMRVSTCTDNVCGRSVDRLELWLRGGPSAGGVRLRVDGGEERLIQARQPREGVRIETLKLPDGAHTIELRPAGDGETWIYGVAFERSAAGVIVDTLGIPGMRAVIWLHWRADRQVKLIRNRAPHLVVLAYGTNDVGDDAPHPTDQLESWRRVLARVKAAAPRAGCLIVGPTDRPLPPGRDGKRLPRPKTDAILAVQRKAAAEFGCGHWDAFAAMGGHGAMPRWVAAGLGQRDHVHLTATGYAVLAERWLAALLEGLPVDLRRPPASIVPSAPGSKALGEGGGVAM